MSEINLNLTEKNQPIPKQAISNRDMETNEKPLQTQQLYCSYIHLPGDEYCFTISEWSTPWTAASALIALAVCIIGGLKILSELKHLRKRSDEDAALKRTEFFLTQHRRLFDDKDLFEVLSHIDGDDIELADIKIWDKKRKFLTFIEEIALLIESKKVNSNVAYYMFGYYARSARDGNNFNIGIKTDIEHWALFNKFCDDSETFSNEFNPKKITNLRL